MNFLRKLFNTDKATQNDELDGLSPEDILFSQVCDEMPTAWTICQVIAVHDLSLPIVYDVFSRLQIMYMSKVFEHLEKNGIIRFGLKMKKDGILIGGWFNLVNPVYGHIIMKRITNEEYHNGVFRALQAIDECIEFRRFDEKTKFILSPYLNALPQAIHVWKEALKYKYDDLIEQFWNVPLDIMKYMANVKPVSELEYAPIRQFAKETKPAYDRLFPLPAPWYSRFSFIWVLYDWDEFWEAVGDDRTRFVRKHERLNFYLNYKF